MRNFCPAKIGSVACTTIGLRGFVTGDNQALAQPYPLHSSASAGECPAGIALGISSSSAIWNEEFGVPQYAGLISAHGPCVYRLGSSGVFLLFSSIQIEFPETLTTATFRVS